jgi:hypothetical protein
MPFPYPKRAIARLPKSARDRSYPVGNRPFALKPFVSVVDRLLPDPPKSPLRRPTLRRFLSPPSFRGARGDLASAVNSNL